MGFGNKIKIVSVHLQFLKGFFPFGNNEKYATGPGYHTISDLKCYLISVVLYKHFLYVHY